MRIRKEQIQKNIKRRKNSWKNTISQKAERLYKEAREKMGGGGLYTTGKASILCSIDGSYVFSNDKGTVIKDNKAIIGTGLNKPLIDKILKNSEVTTN